MWDEVTNTLCNLDFIQAKAVAKMTYELVLDVNAVLEVLPDDSKNNRKEKERQALLDKYAKDLILYAKGELTILKVPESITPWSQEKIDTEIERVKTNPTRLDILKDFANFLGQESSNLQEYAYEFPHFSTQLAWNYAREGSVCLIVNKSEKNKLQNLLLQSDSTRPEWNPFPLKLKMLRGCRFVSWAFMLTPDGRYAIADDIENCIIWDVNTGQIIRRLLGQDKFISFVYLTSDCKRAFSVSRDFNPAHYRTLNIWDAENGQLIDKIDDFNCEDSVDITPDGKYAFSAHYNNACAIWDLDRKQIIREFLGHQDSVLAVSVTPDHKLGISGSYDNTCILWDLESGHAIKILVGHKSSVCSICITPDGNYAISGSMDKTCILWDLTSGQIIKILYGHNDSIFAVSITPDGKLAVSNSADGIFIFWNLNDGKIIKEISNSSFDECRQLNITPDGRFSLLNFSRVYTLINLENGKTIDKGLSKASRLIAINTTPDGGKAIVHYRNSTSVIWILNKAHIIENLNQENDLLSSYIQNEFSSSCITPDRRWGIQANPEGFDLLDLGDQNISQVFVKYVLNNPIPVATSPDGKCVIIDNVLYNLITGLKVRSLSEDISIAAGISPDGKKFILGFDDAKCIYGNLATGEIVQNVNWNEQWMYFFSSWLPVRLKYRPVKFIIFCPDGHKIVTLSFDYRNCIVWNLNAEKVIAQFSTDFYISAISLLPGGIGIGPEKGGYFVLKGSKELLCPDPGLVTCKKMWDFILHEFKQPIADCPICGYRFSPPVSVLATIEEITKKAGLKPEQSPCLEFPDEAWEDPGLLGNCPKCGGELKFNPFIAGGDN